jgi:hypothetical protein
LDLEVKAFYFGVDAEALQLANSLSTARTAGTGEVAADRAILAGRVSGSTDLYVAEVRFSLFLERLLLDDLSQVEVALQVTFLLGALVDPLLVLVLTRLTFTHLETVIIVQLCHLVWVFEEVLFQVPQLLLDHCSPLVLIDLPHCCREAFVPSSVARLRNGA